MTIIVTFQNGEAVELEMEELLSHRAVALAMEHPEVVGSHWQIETIEVAM